MAKQWFYIIKTCTFAFIFFCKNMFRLLIWFLIAFVLFALYTQALSQIRIIAFNDIGRNNLSKDIYFNPALENSFIYKNHSLNTAYQFCINKYLPNTSTYFVDYSYQFAVSKHNFIAKIFFMYHAFSKLAFEHNIGLSATYFRKHFRCELGTHLRSLGVSKKYMQTHRLEKRNHIYEKFNMVYLISASLNPYDKNWNIEATITNMDYFLLNQETNPMVNLKTHYQWNKQWDVFWELWYNSAGSFNLSINPFDCFFRTGISCEIAYQ